MATEPERPIEKLLRDAAGKRRNATGGPFEMHPATRRLLQGEVRRTLGTAGPAKRSVVEMVLRSGPRLVWGMVAGASLIILAVMVAPMFRNQESETLLAKNEPVTAPEPLLELAKVLPDTETNAGLPTRPEPGILVASAEESERRLAMNRSDKDAAETLSVDINQEVDTSKRDELKKSEVAQAAPPAQQNAAVPLESASAANTRRYGLSRAGSGPVTQSSASPPAAAPVQTLADSASPVPSEKAQPLPARASADTRALAGSTAVASNHELFAKAKIQTADRQETPVGQRFVRATATPALASASAKNEPAALPILTSFQVEQAGKEMRIIDQDGSIYRGYLQIADTRPRLLSDGAVKLTSPRENVPVQRTRIGSVTAASSVPVDRWVYPFQVSGTNLTLKQNVIFTGSLMFSTNTAAWGWMTNTVAPSAGRLVVQPSNAIALPLFDSRISGKAAIGAQPQIEINAVPANP